MAPQADAPETSLSRRDFLGASALSLLGMATGSPRARGGASGSPLETRNSRLESLEDHLLYVGTYTGGGRTEGVYLVHMNARTGGLRLAGSVNAGPNPSFLAIPPNGRALYAVNEVTEY